MCDVCKVTKYIGSKYMFYNTHLHTLYIFKPEKYADWVTQHLIENEYPNAYNVIATVTSSRTIEMSIAGYRSCIDILNEEMASYLLGVMYGLGAMYRQNNRIYPVDMTVNVLADYIMEHILDYDLNETSIMLGNNYIQVNVNGSSYV